ncbi:O-antigen ligase family protein [Fangia hongkongensis]|uniref:O-antigen ligase family protein n=1 Tax=Fangia hongkongensis TaxID=270495 RepID=UPI000371A8BA|nr:O-antigen ligase family protein [Fangia hongkongensis]MBK2126083.1 O-antigen ligase family protein [Fangia hongkongensis]
MKTTNHILLGFLILGLVILFIAPFSLEKIFYYDQRRMIQLVLLSATAIIALLHSPLRAFIVSCFSNNYKIALIVALLLLSLVISSLNAYYPTISFLYLSQWILLGIFALACCYLCLENQNNIRYFMLLGIVFFIIICSYIAYGYINLDDLTQNQSMLSKRSALIVHPQFLNPRFLDQLLAGLLPLSGALILLSKNPLLKLLTLIGISAGFYLTIITGSRANLVIIFAIFIFGSLFFRRLFLRYFIYMLLAFVIAFFAYLAIQYLTGAEIISALERQGEFLRYNDRAPLIELSINIWKAHPIFGAGSGMYAHYAYLSHNITAAHPHNMWVMLLAEWGIIGILCVVALFIALGLKLFQYRKALQNNLYAMASLFALIGLLVKGLVSGIIVMPASQMLFAVIIGILLSVILSVRQENQKHIARDGKLYTYLISLITLGAAAYTFIFLIKNAPKITPNTYNYGAACQIKNKESTLLSPNLWANGWLTTHNKPIKTLIQSDKLKCP